MRHSVSEGYRELLAAHLRSADWFVEQMQKTYRKQDPNDPLTSQDLLYLDRCVEAVRRSLRAIQELE